MSDDRRNRPDPLEENVEKLLGSSQPELSMPRAAKDRILSVLTGAETPEKPAWRRRAPWWVPSAA